MRTSPETERIRYGWWTTGKVAQELGGVSRRKVRELIERRKLRARDVNEGGKVASYLVDPTSVAEYLARNTIEPESDAAA